MVKEGGASSGGDGKFSSFTLAGRSGGSADLMVTGGGVEGLNFGKF